MLNPWALMSVPAGANMTVNVTERRTLRPLLKKT
jgi:hypothetical protein